MSARMMSRIADPLRAGRHWLSPAPLEDSWGAVARTPGSLLREQAALWEAHGFPEGLLLQGAALQEAEDWAASHGGELGEVEQDFMQACREARSYARRERCWSGLARAALALATIAGLLILRLLLQARDDGLRLALAQQEALEALSVAEEQRRAAEARATQEAVARVTAMGLARDAAWSATAARARLLAAYAHAAAPQDGQLALLLAAEAARQALQGAPDDLTRREAQAALLHALGHPAWAALARGVVDVAPIPRYGCAWRSPDGRLLAASESAELVVWDAGSGALLRTLEGSAGFRNGAWSHDGGRVAAIGASYQRVGVWDAGIGEMLWEATATQRYYASLAWSPDDSRLLLLCADGEILVADAATGSQVTRLPRVPEAESAAQAWWSTDGRDITVQAGLGLYACDVAAGACWLQSSSGVSAEAKPDDAREVAIAWLAAGQRPMLADLHDLAELANARAGRSLTSAEWLRYLGASAPYRPARP